MGLGNDDALMYDDIDAAFRCGRFRPLEVDLSETRQCVHAPIRRPHAHITLHISAGESAPDI